MKKIHVKGRDEVWDSVKSEFVSSPSGTLLLEHSLLSISKWESKYHKSFLKTVQNKAVTNEEIRYYVQCMTLNDVPPDIYNGLTRENMDEIFEYISDPMTATTINVVKGVGGAVGRPEVITSELIYYWMVVHQIPFECQKWHLNRLMTLIQVCNVKNAPSKKMGKRDVLRQNRSLNAARRARSHSRG